MKERIKELRKALNMKQNDFANELNLATNYISLIESGKNAVSDKFIFNICKTFNVNEAWLRTGEGEMFLPKDFEEEVAELVWQIVKKEDLNDLEREQYLELIKIITATGSEDVDLLLRVAKRFQK